MTKLIPLEPPEFPKKGLYIMEHTDSDGEKPGLAIVPMRTVFWSAVVGLALLYRP